MGFLFPETKRWGSVWKKLNGGLSHGFEKKSMGGVEAKPTDSLLIVEIIYYFLVARFLIFISLYVIGVYMLT